MDVFYLRLSIFGIYYVIWPFSTLQKIISPSVLVQIKIGQGVKFALLKGSFLPKE